MAEGNETLITPDIQISEVEPRILSVQEQIDGGIFAREKYGEDPEFKITQEIEERQTALILNAYRNGIITQDQLVKTIAARTAENRVVSTVDYLTELYNRRGGMRRGEEAILLSERTGAPLTAAMIDLDNFKGVNDSLGHLAGDTILKAAADHMKASVRASDMGIRYGGDEFLLFLQDADLEQGGIVAKKLGEAAPEEIGAIAEMQEINLPQDITFSIGVAERKPKGNKDINPSDETTKLTHLADMAASMAKFLGKNRVVKVQEIEEEIVYEDLSDGKKYTATFDEKGKLIDAKTYNG